MAAGQRRDLSDISNALHTETRVNHKKSDQLSDSLYIKGHHTLRSKRVRQNHGESLNALIDRKYNPYQGNMAMYYINLDASIKRKEVMDEHLNSHGYRFQRLKGYTLNDIYIPRDVQGMWTSSRPVVYTEEPIPSRSMINQDSPLYNFSILLSGLWGRRRFNRIKEVGCTISHLLAIHHACQEATIHKFKYALIMEDDIFIPFQVNFTALIESAPVDFGILQVFNSNEESMENTWKQYKAQSKLWIPRYHAAAAQFWSTCAFIINCDVLRPIIQHIVKFKSNGWIDVKLISSPHPPKIEWGYQFCDKGLPTECCFDKNLTSHTLGQTTSADNTNEKIICTYSPKGYQADSFIYAMAKTYVLSAPLITNGITGNLSTFHQDHVANLHHNAFIRQRKYMNDMQEGRARLPAFASVICSKPLPIAKQVSRVTECNYRYINLRASNSSYVSNIPTFYHIIPSSSLTKSSFNQRSIVETVGLNYQPIPSILSREILIPDSVLVSWNVSSCRMDAHASDIPKNLPLGTRIVIRGLCGRSDDKISSLADLISHLRAIYYAVYDSSSQSEYALISDDSISEFPFDIDYDKLGGLLSAAEPSWGIFQLSSVYEDPVMTSQWLRYIKGHYKLYTSIPKNKPIDGWPWKTYLVSKRTVKRVIDSIMQLVENPHPIISPLHASDHIFNAKIIASSYASCLPAMICSKNKLIKNLPTYVVESPNGIAYDVFIPSMVKSLLSTVPHFKGNKNEILLKAIRTVNPNATSEIAAFPGILHHILVRQNEFIASILEDRQPMLPYAAKSCVTSVKRL